MNREIQAVLSKICTIDPEQGLFFDNMMNELGLALLMASFADKERAPLQPAVAQPLVCLADKEGTLTKLYKLLLDDQIPVGTEIPVILRDVDWSGNAHYYAVRCYKKSKNEIATLIIDSTGASIEYFKRVLVLIKNSIITERADAKLTYYQPEALGTEIKHDRNEIPYTVSSYTQAGDIGCQIFSIKNARAIFDVGATIDSSDGSTYKMPPALIRATEIGRRPESRSKWNKYYAKSTPVEEQSPEIVDKLTYFSRKGESKKLINTFQKDRNDKTYINSFKQKYQQQLFDFASKVCAKIKVKRGFNPFLRSKYVREYRTAAQEALMNAARPNLLRDLVNAPDAQQLLRRFGSAVPTSIKPDGHAS